MTHYRRSQVKGSKKNEAWQLLLFLAATQHSLENLNLTLGNIGVYYVTTIVMFLFIADVTSLLLSQGSLIISDLKRVVNYA